MGVDGVDVKDRIPEEHAVAVLRANHSELVGVVMQAMRDRNTPEAVLAEIDETIRAKALAARRVIDAKKAEGDLDSEGSIGVTIVLTDAGKAAFLSRFDDLSDKDFRDLGNGHYSVRFDQGVYNVGPAVASDQRPRRVQIFRRVFAQGTAQTREGGVSLEASGVVSLESNGGKRWRNLELAARNGKNGNGASEVDPGAALRTGDKTRGNEFMPEDVQYALMTGAAQGVAGQFES